MKNKMIRLLITALAVSALMAGCGKKAESTVPADSVLTESEMAASSADESSPVGDIPETTPEPQKLLNTANAEGQIDESLPEYLQNKETPDVFVIEDPGKTYAEGYLIAPGTKVSAASSAVEGSVGTPVSVATPKGTYTVTITGYDTKDVESGQAVTINYTYQNMNISSNILVGDYGFALTGENGVAFSVASFDDKEKASPEPVGEGKSSGGTLTFLITGTPDRVTLYYNDTTKSDVQQFYWTLTLD